MSQRLLVVGKRGGILQWYEHLIAAARSMPGVEVDSFALNHNGFRERATKKIYALSDPANADNLTAKHLAQKLEQFQPSTIVIADLFYLSQPVLAALNRLCGQCYVAHWIGDFFDERLTQSREVIDQYYFSDSGLVSDAQSMGLENADYLPLAFNPNIFNVDASINQKSDKLLFIGAWSENREALIRGIQQPMRVIGKGWDKMQDTAHHVTAKNIPNTAVAKLYQQHNFVLNNVNSANIRNGLNMRCFEVPACGALLITDDVPDLTRCYRPDADVVCYRDAQQLAEQYTRLLNYRPLVASIQQTGTRKARETHTYAHRLQTILADAN